MNGKRIHDQTRDTNLSNAIAAMEKQSGQTLDVHCQRLAKMQCDRGDDMQAILAGVAAKLGVYRDDFPQQEQELPQEIACRSWREIIKNRIESKDYSFNALGNAIKVSPSVVTRFVKGQRDVRLDTAEKMCEELDLVLVPRECLAKADQ
jgi:ribosome-binding protein aMBF1 (putative translation factor)